MKIQLTQKQKKIRREELSKKQNGKCAFCGKGEWCSACEHGLEHKGGSCKKQLVNTIDHNHACCKTGCCHKCIRGLVHPFCNRAIGLIENSPDITDIASYIKRGKPDNV